jgi:hypothetical protein
VSPPSFLDVEICEADVLCYDGNPDP